ncbi:MAG: hypothetical protein IPF73_14740 [Betaproteobacteria bacterium]|nr:hypothetical protein [Betaproteobacteria bacterium]
MVVGGDDGVGVRFRDHARKHLEPIHVVALALRRVDALDGEAQQVGRVGIGGVDGERDGVDAGDRENLVAADGRGT